MKLESLYDLYVNELADLHHAENQIIKALPKMIESSTNVALRTALTDHLEQTRDHSRRLEQVFLIHNEQVRSEKSKGMQGIIDEGENVVKHSDDPALRDAAIIAAAQKVEHYEVASYGCVRTWAQQMGNQDAAAILQRTLNEEEAADQRLTDIARTLNFEAVRRAS